MKLSGYSLGHPWKAGAIVGDLSASWALGPSAVRWLAGALMLCWVLVQIIGRVLAIFRAHVDWLENRRRRRAVRPGGRGATRRRGRRRLVG
jgi:hypothetical protein